MLSDQYAATWEKVAELSRTLLHYSWRLFSPGGCQFPANSYDAPIYSGRLKIEGLEPVFSWKACDLAGNYEPTTILEAGIY